MGTPLPPVANVVRFVVEGTTPHAPWVNAIHYGYTGTPPTAANCQALAVKLYGLWVDNFPPLMLTSATLEGVTCIDLSSALGGTGQHLGGTNGSRGIAELPGSSAVVLSKSVARRYRGGHPRSYLVAGIATDMADTGHWAGGLVAAVTGAYEAVQTGMNGTVEGATTLTTEVVVSYFDTVSVPLAPHRRIVPLVLPVVGVVAQPRIGTQRRRIGV